MTYIDLTHTFHSEIPVYPGDPAPKIKKIADFNTDGFFMYKVSTGMHVGTHMDAPLHMIEGGKKMSEFAPEKFIGSGKLIDARGKNLVEPDVLEEVELVEGDIVIVMTGFSEKFREKIYFNAPPELSIDFAQKLVEAKVKIVGIDFASPDKPPFKVHKILLGSEILIIENLTNLEKLIGIDNFEVSALPVKYETEAAPVRVVARID
jgi:kynurenine formamidase